LRILVDEDSQARSQLNVLRGDGHDVVAVGELDKNGTPDSEVFELAQLLERMLLTHNTEDFHELHRERPEHRGIMAVFRDADPRKNMSHAHVAAAIRQLEASGVAIAGDFHVLNHWR
jgi:predicted nuclease of predicted toxin-antitoxin system